MRHWPYVASQDAELHMPMDGQCDSVEDEQMKILRVGILLLLGIALSGCATITRGTKDFFVIESEPTGATVALSNGLNCVTPCGMEIPRKHAFTASFSMEGYKPLQVEVVPKQAAAGTAGMAGNVLIGGIIGIVTDSTTGAMKDLHPNPLVVSLAASDSTDDSSVLFPDEEAEDEVIESIDEEETSVADQREAEPDL